MNQIIQRATGVVLFFLMSFNILSQNSDVDREIVRQRKFDYYFHSALNAKALERYDEALDLLNHCIALDSTNANVLVELAAFENLFQNHEAGYDLVKKAVSYDPDNYYYNMILADMSQSLEKNEEVIGIYQHLLERYPAKVDLYFNLATAYNQAEEYDKAIEALDSLQKFTGANDAVAMNKFKIYSQAGDKEKAFAEIEGIAQKHPDNGSYLLMIGELYLEEGESEKALSYFERAKELDPESPSLILSMVKYYDHKGDREASSQEILQAMSNAKMDVDTKLQLLGRYVSILTRSKQDLAVTEPLIQSLFEQHPNNSHINLIYGELLMMQKREEEALPQYEVYMNDNPQDMVGYEQVLRIILPDETKLDKVAEVTQKGIAHIPQAPQFYFYLGMVNMIKGKYREAQKVYEAGIEKAEFNNPQVKSDFYGQLGDIHHELKREAKAFEMYEAAIALNPRNTHVLNNYSYFLSLKRENLDKAETMSSRTVQEEPTNPTFLDTYGWILFEQGAYTMAKIYLEKAVEYSKDDPSATIHEHYGDVLAKTDDLEGAVEQWKKARELGGSSKVLKKKIRRKKYFEK